MLLLLSCKSEEIAPELQNFYGKFFISEIHTERYTTSSNEGPTYTVQYDQQKVMRFFADGTVEYFVVIPPAAVKDGFFIIGSFTMEYPSVRLYGLGYNKPTFTLHTDKQELYFTLDGLLYTETDQEFR